jgi:hypothetical protein
MTYEGVTLENGLVVKNGSLVTKPDYDSMKKQSEELIARINSGPLPQTVAKRKAVEDAKNKKRR